MSTTRAADNEVSGLSDERYCTVNDVLTVLRRVAVDAAYETLGSWLSGTDRDETIRFLIPDARMWTDGKAGHDFDYHEAVDIAVDGSGLDCQDLSQFNFVPLLSVSDLVITGSDEDADDYKYYSDGRIRPVETLSTIKYTTGRSSPFFLLGTQNVAMTITWGYETPPYDIRVAQARKVAADILSQLSAADSEDGIVPGGTTSLKYEGLNIRLGSEGQYGPHIKRLEAAALEACLRYRFPKTLTADAGHVGSYAMSSKVMWS